MASSWLGSTELFVAGGEGLLQRVLVTKQSVKTFNLEKANTYSTSVFPVHNLYRYFNILYNLSLWHACRINAAGAFPDKSLWSDFPLNDR